MNFIEQLKLVKLTEIENYLKSNGWQITASNIDGLNKIVKLTTDNKELTTLIPSKENMEDYLFRMEKLFFGLGRIELRDKESIISDILNNGAQAGKQKVDTDKVLIKLPSHEQSVAELGVSASSPDFNLSDRIGFFNQGYIILRKEGVEWIHKEDVKEFIKRLKEYMRCYCSMASNEEAWKFFSDEIDNLAGDKLT